MSADPRLADALAARDDAQSMLERAALLWSNANRIDPDSDETRASLQVSATAKATLAEAERALTARAAELAHEDAMNELAAKQRGEAAHSAKVDAYRALLAQLSTDALEADLRPLLPRAVELYRALCELSQDLQEVVARRAVPRAKARVLASELRANDPETDAYAAVHHPENDLPEARLILAEVLRDHAAVFGLPFDVFALLAPATPTMVRRRRAPTYEPPPLPPSLEAMAAAERARTAARVAKGL